MPNPGLTAAVSRARRACAPEARSDGGLLAAFLAACDADAFAELVARFGPMVFAVCRRVTGHHQDAEDAFQATFVILARKAASIAPREAVGNWLYGVAVRTAREARAMAAKRRAREVPVAEPPDAARPAPEPDDLAAVMHEELAELPDKFRTLLVLCDLRGEPQTEVAERLGLPPGTVYSRLAKARALLADRLRKRGIALSAAGLLAAVGEAARTAVPAGLGGKAVAAALSPDCVPAAVAALTGGVFRAMLLQKLTVAAFAALLLAACAYAVAAPPAPAAEAPKPLPLFVRADDKKPQPAKPAGPGAILLVRDGPYHVLTPDGKKLAELPLPKDTRGGGLACLSPDGTRAAFAVTENEERTIDRDDKPLPLKIVIRKVEKPDSEKTFDMPSWHLTLCWAADGKRLVVGKHPDRSDRGKDVENLLLDPETGKTEKLDLPAGAWVLDCGRDGKTFLVAFVAEKKLKLGLAAAGDSAVRELTAVSNWPPGNVTGRLSPDGTKVLFAAADPQRKNAHKWGISQRPYLLDVKTKKAEPLPEFPENGRVTGIAWSPDGRRLAYSWHSLDEEALKKDTFEATETEAFLIVADSNGKNPKTVASDKGTSAASLIFGSIDWK